jgi:hypothetical protein
MVQRTGTSSRPGRGRTPDVPGFPWRITAILAVVGCLSLYLWFWIGRSKPIGAGLLLVPLLFLLTAPAMIRARRTETGFDLAGLMATGLALRFAAAYYRWDNGSDAHTYNAFGSQLAHSFRSLHFDVDVNAPVPGTGGLRYIAGLVSVPAGSNEFAKFCLFTWLGFWGCVLLYQAFVTALPNGDRKRYALLIFLWPSLIFWPSSIGKEAWMLFTLGAAMLGAARVFTRQRAGYSLLFVGLLGGSFVRPHVALLALVAFGLALALGRRTAARPGTITPGSVAKVAGLVLVLLLGGYLVTRTQKLVDPGDTGSASSVGSALHTVQLQTSQGGSQFSAANPNSPLGYGKAAITVLFRPFPTEVHGFDELVASTEALFLFGLAVMSWGRLRTLPRRLRAEPYYLLALVYLLMFVYAFATVGNFGILARERTQLEPFVFVLLAAPAPLTAVHPRRRHASRPFHG